MNRPPITHLHNFQVFVFELLLCSPPPSTLWKAKWTSYRFNLLIVDGCLPTTVPHLLCGRIILGLSRAADVGFLVDVVALHIGKRYSRVAVCGLQRAPHQDFLPLHQLSQWLNTSCDLHLRGSSCLGVEMFAIPAEGGRELDGGFLGGRGTAVDSSVLPRLAL